MTKPLYDALEARGYDTLTPVQKAVTEPELAGQDLLVSAQTGSGKTVGFGLAIAPTLLGEDQRFDRASTPLALVIAPTRELAMQVKRELSWLYAGAGAVMASCVGGMDMRDERRALERGAHIVVATPGRLRDHIMRGTIDLGDIRAVVLDEADEMLDLGFREDLEFILDEAPDTRQTLLFSATVPKSIAALAQNYQKDAVRIETRSETTQHADIEYRAMQVADRDAENAVINTLRFYESPNAIVFCNTRAMVNRLTTRLSNRGFQVVALSGELSQDERTHALQAMRDGRARVCVATDVAARGIDLPKLDLVVHAELPINKETLLHRSGRTGRAGRKGVSALIVTPRSRNKAERILKFAKLTAEWTGAPSREEVLDRDEQRVLDDPIWTDTSEGQQNEFVQKLVSEFSAEQLAAAYMQLYRAQHTAPEELSGKPEKREPRKAFGPSIWYSLSVGRDDDADPRRLLPMLCKAGGISRDDIGAIRIQKSHTFVEILESKAAGFVKSIGPDMRVEDSVLTQLDQAPDLSKMERPARPPRKSGPKPPFNKDSRPPRKEGGAKPYKRVSGDAPYDDDQPQKPSFKKPKRDHDGALVATKKPRHKKKGPPPPAGKPSSKKNKARKAEKVAAKAGGNAAPKRRKS